MAAAAAVSASATATATVAAPVATASPQKADGFPRPCGTACQTPALFFCVERQRLIDAFVPRRYFTLSATADLGGGRLALEWAGNRCFDERAARRAADTVRRCAASGAGTLLVSSVERAARQLEPPAALNTVGLLRAASNGLGLGPHACMQAAEALYISGYISYPRTETSRYPASFDLRPILQAAKLEAVETAVRPSTPLIDALCEEKQPSSSACGRSLSRMPSGEGSRAG